MWIKLYDCIWFDWVASNLMDWLDFVLLYISPYILDIAGT